MITAIKADNIGDYKALFEEASDILSGYERVRTYDTKVDKYYYKDESSDELFLVDTEINSLATFASQLETRKVLYTQWSKTGVEGFVKGSQITTLEEYFSWIKDLGNIVINGEPYGRKYTVLPLDEDHFEINTNTRGINIPGSFKKNGIAVQGDDLAEIVFFEVDRYFDYMDLNNAEIFIQWETPKDANGQVMKSVSSAYIRDIESKPGKLIFGWAISDAITKTAGTLKFSVRFFQWDDEEAEDRTLVYSLSTLPATIVIQPSINFDLEKDYDPALLDDAGEFLTGRLTNSKIACGYAAAVPYYLINLIAGEYDVDGTDSTYDLVVQSKATDTGTITYTWRYQSVEMDGETLGPIIKLEGEKVMIEADMDNLDSATNYFVRNGQNADGSWSYTRYFGQIPPTEADVGTYGTETKDDSGKTIKVLALYERRAGFTIDFNQVMDADPDKRKMNIGYYWAVAENRITNSSTSLESEKAFFPPPTDVAIPEEGQPAVSGILETVIHTETDETTGESVDIPVDEYTLTVAPSNTDGELTYQWYRDDNYVANFGGEAPEWEPIDTPEAKNATYVTALPGHYYVEVTNTRNTRSKSDDSGVCRVTAPAALPQFVNEDVTTKVFQVSAIKDDNCPTIYMDPSVFSDWYSVTWYLAEYDQVWAITPDIALDPGVARHSFNPMAWGEEIALVSKDGDIDGSYYAIVTNHVNGSVKSTEAPEFDDMFKVVY